MNKGYKTIKGYFEANRAFIAEKGEINAAIINIFLGVAMWGHEKEDKDPLTIQQISEKIGIPYTTVSRNLRYLGYGERSEKEGLGLVRTDIYVHNRRQKTVSLTTKGRALRDRILHAFGEDTDNE